MLENAIQSFLGLRYESDRKAGSTSCNLISVTKVGTGKAKTGGTGETNCPTFRGKKTFGRNTAVQFNGSGNTELFSTCHLHQH